MTFQTKTVYDEKEDILYVYKPGKVKQSLDLDKTIWDYNTNNKIIGIQLLNASSFFPTRYERDGFTAKDLLKNIKKVVLSIKYSYNWTYAGFSFVSFIPKQHKEVREHLMVQAPIKAYA